MPTLRETVCTYPFCVGCISEHGYTAQKGSLKAVYSRFQAAFGCATREQQVPTLREMGLRVSAAVRAGWVFVQAQGVADCGQGGVKFKIDALNGSFVG